MNQHALEIADVFRAHKERFIGQHGSALSRQQYRVIRAITCCRTQALGGHVERCDECGHERIAYNSCRNRHCPKCQAGARAAWTAARERELLPTPYFHVVFTIPHVLSPVALQNKKTVYGILFQAAAETLIETAANPKHLGARIGLLAILHTWGQNLMHHPHLHCVIPAGGVAPDGKRWIHCRRGKRDQQPFFLPVRVLSRVFRGKFIDKLKQAHGDGQLGFSGRLASLHRPDRFNQLLDNAVRREWVVYAKRPFGGPDRVLKYLARYTHRVAISNERLVAMNGDQVSFRWKDYAHGRAPKTMTLDACEFMRRFLLHTLPRGFIRIRHYGFLSNRDRSRNIEHCRQLLAADQRGEAARPPGDTTDPGEEPRIPCPSCHAGRMVAIEVFPAQRASVPAPHWSWRRSPEVFDTS
jgi:hypothetical protein